MHRCGRKSSHTDARQKLPAWVLVGRRNKERRICLGCSKYVNQRGLFKSLLRVRERCESWTSSLHLLQTCSDRNGWWWPAKTGRGATLCPCRWRVGGNEELLSGIGAQIPQHRQLHLKPSLMPCRSRTWRSRPLSPSSQWGRKAVGQWVRHYTEKSTFWEASALHSHSPTLFSSLLPLITHNSLSQRDYSLQMRTYKLMLHQNV